MEKQLTKDEFATGINRTARIGLIEKHLENWDGLKRASVEYFYKTGKISGNFLLALEEMMDEYADQKLKPSHPAHGEITLMDFQRAIANHSTQLSIAAKECYDLAQKLHSPPANSSGNLAAGVDWDAVIAKFIETRR